MKRVLIKASGIIPQKGGYISGIGRTNVELITRFAKMQDDEIDFAIYFQGKRGVFYHPEWDIRYYSYPFPNAIIKTNFESFYRRTFFKHDMLHITSNIDNFAKKENVVVTIHDLFNFTKDDEWLIRKCVFNSKAIVTCSDFTKQDILDRYPQVNEDKITVIPWGIDHQVFYPRTVDDISRLRIMYGIKDKYMFTCSCKDPRKNIDTVLEAYAKFCADKDDISLVVAWGNPPAKFLNQYSKEIENKKIIFLPYIGDDELATLYTGAMATVYVSSFEGFGFPILESMACGTPVITCRNSSLSEIGLDLATYVKERDVDELADCMEVFYDGKLKCIKSDLISHVQKYNWDKAASEYLKFYKSAF